MSPQLKVIKTLSHSKNYFVEGILCDSEDSSRRARDVLHVLIESKGMAIVLFDLPEEAIPFLPNERLFHRPKSRIVPLHYCSTSFTNIWDMTGAFGSILTIIVGKEAARDEFGTEEVVQYLKKVPRKFNVCSEIEFNNAFIANRKHPLLILSKVWDGEFLLISSSHEFLNLAHSILLVFGIKVRGDEPDFNGLLRGSRENRGAKQCR